MRWLLPLALAACTDDSLPEAAHHHYEIASASLDSGTSFGDVINALPDLFGSNFDESVSLQGAIQNELLITLMDVQTQDYTEGTPASITTYRGLRQNGMLVAQPGEDPPLSGDVEYPSMIQTKPGTVSFSFAWLGAFVVTFDLQVATIALRDASDTGISGTISGGIFRTDIDKQMLPRFQMFAEAAVQQDCTALDTPPDCGCATSSPGQAVIQYFDTTPDCTITLDEVTTSPEIDSVLHSDDSLPSGPGFLFDIDFTATEAFDWLF